MDDGQTLRAMMRDDAYHVIQVLSKGPSGRTELVSLDGEGQLVRKHIPLALANAAAWAAAMELDEPLLPRIEELYRMPDELVVVYDYVPGTSLAELVGEGGPLDAGEAVRILADVCRAVEALHGRGVVHRDITPGNIIVAADGAHLVDLGIARRHQDGQRHDTTTLGTWGFAAPEQFGFAQTDARSDIFSLGALLGYLLTGVMPGSDMYEEALSAVAAGKDLVVVVRKATAFEPGMRYQGALELVEAAHAALASGEGTPAVRSAGAVRSENAGRPGVSPLRSPREFLFGLFPAKQGQRTFNEAPLVERIGAVAFWLVMWFVAMLIGSLCVDYLLGRPTRWQITDFIIAVIILAAAGVLSSEVLATVRLAGPYARAPHRMRTLLLRFVAILAMAFLLALSVTMALTPASGAS